MASKAPVAPIYQPRRDRRWRRRRERRQAQPTPSIAALLTVIPSLERAQLSRLVHRMIDRMDTIDGDADFEDATNAEDDFRLTGQVLSLFGERGPGCPLSDPGGGNVEDEGQTNEIAPYTGPIATAWSRNLADERGPAL